MRNGSVHRLALQVALVPGDDEGFGAVACVLLDLSFLIYAAVSGVLILALLGLMLLPIVAIRWLVLVMVSSDKANNGEYYRYLLPIRFIR
jgi:uncharacterized Tic20 family protein